MERNRGFRLTVAVCILIAALGVSAQAQYAGGSGTPDDPYLIYTPEQMNAIGADPNDWDKHFQLMADLDLAQYTGTEFNLIGMPYRRGTGYSAQIPFTGVFDGNGHVISNFRYACDGESDIGLFRRIDDPNAVVKRLGLVNATISAGTGYNTGSLVGYLEAGTVTECYATGVVVGNNWVGGLVGYGGTIDGCYTDAVVKGRDHVGGLAGSVKTIVNSYAQGTVIGNEYVGGLVGYDSRTWGSTVTNCYAAALVIGASNTGGLVGRDVFTGVPHEDVVASFWDMETSRQTTSAGGAGKTTAQMQKLVTFRAWSEGDSAGIWTIDEGEDYPRLAWENRPGTAIDSLEFSDLLAGTGTPDDPYLIHTADEIELVTNEPSEWGKHFRLMADIDLSTHPGVSFSAIGDMGPYSFAGNFDGSGHTISNFTSAAEDHDSAGFFAEIHGDHAEIRNLGLINPVVEGDRYVGALAGLLGGGTIANCFVEDGLVLGSENAGGLVGWNAGTIKDCHSSAVVIAGYTGGGLVGDSYTGHIRNCYATGIVMGDTHDGGLVGIGYERDIIASFWDVETSGLGNMCGYGQCNDSLGKATVEMMTAAPFLTAGWDFVGEGENGAEEIWWIDEGVDYPRLWWERPEGEF